MAAQLVEVGLSRKCFKEAEEELMEDEEMMNCLTKFMMQKYHKEKGVEQNASDSLSL